MQAALAYEDAKEMAESKDSEVRLSLANRKNIQPEILYYLADDDNANVRQAIASNALTPKQADLLLAKDNDSQVRMELAEKIGKLAPELDRKTQRKAYDFVIKTLEILVEDQQDKVREIISDAVKELDTIPVAIVRRLACDEVDSVASPVLQSSPILTDEDLLKIMHPFTPFISEEIWHLIGEREDEDCIMVKDWPTISSVNEELLANFNSAVDVISNIRTIRKEKNIANKIQLDFKTIDNEKGARTFDSVITKIGNLSSFEYVDSKVDNAFSFLVKSNEYYIPFSEDIDIEAEVAKIKADLEYAQGSLRIVQKKLSNERFVSGAPEQVVASEKKKEADALAKIKVLEEKLTAFA